MKTIPETIQPNNTMLDLSKRVAEMKFRPLHLAEMKFRPLHWSSLSNLRKAIIEDLEVAATAIEPGDMTRYGLIFAPLNEKSVWVIRCSDGWDLIGEADGAICLHLNNPLAFHMFEPLSKGNTHTVEVLYALCYKLFYTEDEE